MKTKSTLNVLALCLLLASMLACANDPIGTDKTSNSQVSVDLLFQNDGCKVYRFFDAGYYHYYAVCSSGFTSTSAEVPHGKHSQPEEIQTAKK